MGCRVILRHHAVPIVPIDKKPKMRHPESMNLYTHPNRGSG